MAGSLTILVCIQHRFAIWTIPDAYVDRLRRALPGHRIVHARDDASALEQIGDAEVAFMGMISPAQFAAARRLRWIHSPAAGIGGMLFREMVESPVQITNSRGMSADTIAEHVLAVVLAIFRRLPEAFRSQAARTWAQDAIGAAGNRMIAGSRVLVVGLGAIGGAVAERMSVLGAEVTAIRRDVSRGGAGVRDVAPPGRLRELLPSADIVVIAAPHTRETRRLIGAAELAVMRPQAVLVNVSRGQLVDEDALLDVLRRGAIAGAALDVFNDEPLPPDSPFWTLPNVLITPHTAGFRPDHWDAAIRLFVDNVRRYEAGEPLRNLVDKHAGY